MKHLLLTGALALAANVAIAAIPPLEHKGVAEPTTQALSTYGVQVPTRSALKSLLPKGWRLFVHRSATLPETISWKPGDSWTQLLADAAEASGTAILVDWEDRAVYIRSPQVALEEGARRAEIAQAASTPMPKLTERVPHTTEPTVKTVALPPAEPAPVLVAAPKDVEVPLQAVPAPEYEQAIETPTAVVAFDRPGAASTPRVIEQGVLEAAGPMQALAAGLAPSTEAPAPEHAPALLAALQAMRDTEALRPAPARVSGPAPVRPATPATPAPPAAAPDVAQATPTSAPATVLPVAAPAPQKDDGFRYVAPTALNKPMLRHVLQGVANRYNLPLVWLAPNDLRMPGPVTLLGDNLEQDLHLVRRALGPAFPVAFGWSNSGVRAESTDTTWLSQHLQEKATHAAQAHAEQTRMTQVGVDPSTYEQAAAFQLVVEAGQPLEYALSDFLTKHGYTMDWQVAGGFEASRPQTFEGMTLAETLGLVLPQLGISADIYTVDKHVVVRPGTSQD